MAEDPVWLVLWVATVSFAEATYWPVFHATAAVLGVGEVHAAHDHEPAAV